MLLLQTWVRETIAYTTKLPVHLTEVVHTCRSEASCLVKELRRSLMYSYLRKDCCIETIL